MALAVTRHGQFRLGSCFLIIVFSFGLLNVLLHEHYIPDYIIQSGRTALLMSSLESSVVLHERHPTAASSNVQKSVLKRIQSTSRGTNNVPNAATTAAVLARVSTNKPSALAGLSCEQFGGPNKEAAKEMVYWQDIPADSLHVSRFRKRGVPQYLTFEPDRGGWNNIRMALETVIGLAFGMGRTLVLPPEQPLYLLRKGKSMEGKSQRDAFTFAHFFHTEDISKEHAGMDIITMEEFLKREVMTGKIRDRNGKAVFPPGNRTNWDGEPDTLFKWLRANYKVLEWNSEECLAVFPRSSAASDMQAMLDMNATITKNPPRWEDYIDNPVDVDSVTFERLKESWAGRHHMCMYDRELQSLPVIHVPGGKMSKEDPISARFLVHFYAFLFFADWNQDLWLKRFVRDHIRYTDEIQCAAARVVAAVREHARKRDPVGNPQGLFDALHVRRGDFQFKATRVEASEIYEQTKKVLKEGSTVYIATDERDQSFFQVLKEHYDVLFLDDFHEALGDDVNTNFYGMVDVLIATRSRYFFGVWFSTFTGYINRLRGYHATNDKTPGYEKGIIPSWYYALSVNFDQMQHYIPLRLQFWAREFPTAWRLINTGMEAFHQQIAPAEQ